MMRCNRTACKAELGPFQNKYWNTSTRAWYCQECADRINEANPNLCVHPNNLPSDFEDAFTAAAAAATKAGWTVINEPLDKTIARVSIWMKDLHGGMYINCVYCGHRYGPKEKTPAVMADVLKAHIRECPAHPLSKALRALCVVAEELNGGQYIAANEQLKFVVNQTIKELRDG